MTEINEMPHVVFDKYVVSYIDILGFSSFIKKVEKVETEEGEKFTKLLEMVKENPVFNGNLEDNIFLPEDMDLVCRQISDGFIITAPCSKTSVKLPTLIAVSIKAIQIYQALLSIGLGARGGIAVGNLIVTDGNIFGSAFLDAYETESVKAIFPRILLHHTAVKELDDLVEYRNHRYSFFAQIDDDVFLDSFFDFTVVSKDGVDITKKLKTFKECIESSLKNTLDLKIRIKWIWIALHFNAHLSYDPLEVGKIEIESIFPVKLNYLNPSELNWMASMTAPAKKGFINTKLD